MIPPNQGSSLSHDSSLNRTPRENCYISGYEGPNEILKDVPNRAWTLLSAVKFSDPDTSPILIYSECTKTTSFSILGFFRHETLISISCHCSCISAVQ